MSDWSPFVSVVVPTRNRGVALARCLTSLAEQRWASDRMEVLVVNDGGAPVPPDVRAALGECIPCTVMDQPHGGPAAARNAGVDRARGEVLAFIDDDCIADPGWLAALLARLEAAPGAAVGGRVINALADNRYARTSQLLVTALYRYYHEEGRGHLPFFTTNNLAVRAETFTSVGPFDASFTFASEDRDWCDRCLHAGHQLAYAPDAVVHHAHPLTFPSFIRQHFHYGEGARRFRQSRTRRRGTRTRLEPWAFYGGLLRAPFDAHEPEAIRVVALILLSQVVAAIGWAVAGGRA